MNASGTGKRGRGRPRDTKLGEDLAVLYLLSRPGAQASVDALAELAGTSRERTGEILEQLSERPLSANEEQEPLLPLYRTEDGMVARVEAPSSPALRPLRLTREQAREVAEALSVLGLAENDDLVERLVRAFFPAGGAKDELEIPPSPFEEGTAETLVTIARSLGSARPVQGDPSSVSQRPVSFTYQGTNDVMARTRVAVPRFVRAEDGSWLVDTFEPLTGSTRTFFVRLMSGARCEGDFVTVPRQAPDRPEGGTVRVTCTPAAARIVRTWEGARVLKPLDGGGEVIEVPYYRGDWLPRHLIALGDTVAHDSAELAQEMRDIAAYDLERARKLRGAAVKS